jgi:hypothetical protein
MMHVTGDGERMYVANSSPSTLDHSGRSYFRLVHIGPVGMKVDRFINGIDFGRFSTGRARGHDMLLNGVKRPPKPTSERSIRAVAPREMSLLASSGREGFGDRPITP